MPYKDKAKQREFQAKWMAARRADYLKDKKCHRCPETKSLVIAGEGTLPKGIFSHKNREEILNQRVILCDDCYLSELADKFSEQRFVHGHAIGKTRTYKTWESMKRRCLNPNADNYPWYGGRGIKICTRWLNSFVNFLADMGERPEGTTIDRIDGNKNYEPGNCRWATPEVQGRNKRARKAA